MSAFDHFAEQLRLLERQNEVRIAGLSSQAQNLDTERSRRQPMSRQTDPSENSHNVDSDNLDEGDDFVNYGSSIDGEPTRSAAAATFQRNGRTYFRFRNEVTARIEGKIPRRQIVVFTTRPNRGCEARPAYAYRMRDVGLESVNMPDLEIISATELRRIRRSEQIGVQFVASLWPQRLPARRYPITWIKIVFGQSRKWVLRSTWLSIFPNGQGRILSHYTISGQTPPQEPIPREERQNPLEQNAQGRHMVPRMAQQRSQREVVSTARRPNIQRQRETHIEENVALARPSEEAINNQQDRNILNWLKIYNDTRQRGPEGRCGLCSAQSLPDAKLICGCSFHLDCLRQRYPNFEEEIRCPCRSGTYSHIIHLRYSDDFPAIMINTFNLGLHGFPWSSPQWNNRDDYFFPYTEIRECSICYEAMQLENMNVHCAVIESCRHMFHAACLAQCCVSKERGDIRAIVSGRQATCPYCRGQINDVYNCSTINNVEHWTRIQGNGGLTKIIFNWQWGLDYDSQTFEVHGYEPFSETEIRGTARTSVTHETPRT